MASEQPIRVKDAGEEAVTSNGGNPASAAYETEDINRGSCHSDSVTATTVMKATEVTQTAMDSEDVIKKEVHIHVASEQSLQGVLGFGLKELKNVKMDVLSSRKISTKTKQYYLCNIQSCGKVFNEKSAQERHIQEHGNEYACVQGAKCYKTPRDLKRHQKGHTQGAILLKCEYSGCEKTFKCKRLLDSHQYSHCQVRAFHCDYPNCGKSFKTKNYLRDHQKIHSFQGMFTCDIEGCGKVFPLKRSLSRHRRRHNTDKPFLCENCFKTFRTRTNLNLHVKTHCSSLQEREEHLCPKTDCAAILHSKHALNRHVKRVHGTVRPHLCPDCGKAFKSNDNLKVHRLSHSGIKPFVCDFEGCLRAFKTRSNLKSHRYLHTGEKPFVCPRPECRSVLRSQIGLQRHLEEHKKNTELSPSEPEHAEQSDLVAINLWNNSQNSPT